LVNQVEHLQDKPARLGTSCHECTLKL
jgi:hypothetical protein